MPEVVIRCAGPADLDALADVWWRSRQASIPAIPPPAHPFPEVQLWLDGLIQRAASASDGETEVWVAIGPEPEGRAVAVLVLDGDELDQLYVDPAHTGGGIGSQLVAYAQHRRPEGLALWTFQANERARAFYRRHGFMEGRTTDGDNEEHAPDIRLAWQPVRP